MRLTLHVNMSCYLSVEILFYEEALAPYWNILLNEPRSSPKVADGKKEHVGTPKNILQIFETLQITATKCLHNLLHIRSHIISS